MRPLTIALAGAALYAAAGSLVPFGWSHHLSEGCHWLPAPIWSHLGLSRGEPSSDDNMARAYCLYGRGMKSRLDVPFTVRETWPSRMELAKWSER